jgi:hypothetical protein
LHGSEGCLIEVLFRLALGLALWFGCRFLFHASIMAG